MAAYSIDIPADKGQRILDAFGHGDGPAGGTWVPATKAEVLAQLKEFIRQRVMSYESRAAATTKEREVTNETW